MLCGCELLLSYGQSQALHSRVASTKDQAMHRGSEEQITGVDADLHAQYEEEPGGLLLVGARYATAIIIWRCVLRVVLAQADEGVLAS